jgi:hypothetical protein
MNQSSSATRSWRESLRKTAAQLFPGLAGIWIAIALTKLGNPVILAQHIPAPTNWLEAVFQPWPVAWGYLIFAAAFAAGLPLWKWHRNVPRFFVWTPLAWYAWQCLSALQTISTADARYASATLFHFAVCVMAFYLGLFALSHSGSGRAFWIGIIGGWLVVVAIGWRQHFGGLDELREYFYSLPNWREQPAELRAKLTSNRIFSTLVYPNALAGAMLLFSPAVIGVTCSQSRGGPSWWRSMIPTCLALIGTAGCLVWSGSKGGWLIAMALILLVAIVRIKSPAIRVLIFACVLLTGAAGFWVRYRGYFERGATSVSARFDYWGAAISNVRDHPLLGSGPGSFMNVYRRLKAPDSEMTRLVHNDYLEQATDSGIPGAILFATWIAGSVYLGFRAVKGIGAPTTRIVQREEKGRHDLGKCSEIGRLGVWLGIVGLALQSLSEFGLYIPALAWPWFLAMGGLLGQLHDLKTVDKGSGSS